FKINDGEIYYHEKLIPVNYFIKKLDFESTGKRWDNDTISANFSFLPGIGKGQIKGNFSINVNNLDYRYAVIVKQFDLNILAQYLNDLTNYGTFKATLDADVKSKGNFKEQLGFTTKGKV